MTMTSAEYKEEWLFSNALVAFVGALLMGQVWEPSKGTFKLLFFFDVPAYDGLVIFLITAAFFILSFFFAAASVIPFIRSWALSIGKGFSQILELLTWIAFTLSWTSSIPELPLEQWWAWFLVFGGFVLFVFIPFRILLRIFRSRKTARESSDTDGITR